MSSHDILAPALQKYYSALRALDEFGRQSNLFDDISRLDTFFSEFRNITFVIQKGLETEEDKRIYNSLRDELLSGETLRWFVDVRNKTTKQKPFQLKKELIVDVYLPNGKFRLTNPSLTVEYDKSFDDALDTIKRIFINDLHMVEIFFSAKVNFIEDNSNIDFYPQIKKGIIQMDVFMRKVQEVFSCNCDNCTVLIKLIEPLYKNAIFKEINFVNDYAFEIDKQLETGDKVGMYLGIGDSNCVSIDEMRLSLDNPIYHDAQGCIFRIFEKFIVSHVVVFQMQEHSIMPTFMIVFQDNTFQSIPFAATAKSTFYRKVNEIIEKTSFDEVVAIFYCGEYYSYALEQFPEINTMPYSKRIEKANAEVLYFTMLLKQCGEWSVEFDESRIGDDMLYIAERIKSIKKVEDSENSALDWLAPIKEKLEI